MVTLEKFRGKIIAFLDEAQPRFAAKHPKEKPTTIGLYSSPGNGWVSLCINTGDTPTTNEQNCPDFKFVEFDLIEFPEWQEEYESEKPKIKISKTKTITTGPDDGDEGYNEPFFKFLVAIAKDYFTASRCPASVRWVGVQMLDSGFEDFWTVGKVPTSAPVKLQSPVIQVHKNAILFAFSPDNERVFYTEGKTLTAMDLATRKILFAVKPASAPYEIDLAPDGNKLVVQGDRHVVVDAQSGKTLTDFKNRRDGLCNRPLFSPCGQYVISVDWGMINVRDAKNGKVVFEELQPENVLENPSTPADRRFVLYAQDEPLDEAGRRGKRKLLLRNWPLKDGNVREIPTEEHRSNLAVSPSGKLFGAALHKEFTLAEVKTGKITSRCPIETYPNHVAWSPDEQLVAISVGDWFLFLEVPSLKVRNRLFSKYAQYITFSPCSKYVAFKGHIVLMDYLDTFIQSIKPSA